MGGWMWHTNDGVGGDGYMRDVCMHDVDVKV